MPGAPRGGPMPMRGGPGMMPMRPPQGVPMPGQPPFISAPPTQMIPPPSGPRPGPPAGGMQRPP